MTPTPEQELEEMLEAAGWTLECLSPLEVSYDDGSRATGLAAQLVIQNIRDHHEL